MTELLLRVVRETRSLKAAHTLAGRGFYSPFWLYLLLFSLKWAGRKVGQVLQRSYECCFSKYLAVYGAWLYFPFYFLCRRFNLCFVVNIVEGAGHLFIELDYFLRQLEGGALPLDKRYCLITKRGPLFSPFVKLYRKKFFFASASTLLYDLLLPLTMRFTSITVDVGVSRMKYQFPKGYLARKWMNTGYPFIVQLPPLEGIRRTRNYYASRQKMPEWCPMAQFDSGDKDHEILSHLNIPHRKICLVHLKTEVTNATAQATDPLTYLPALNYLQDLGYHLVFVGREQMPAVFNQMQLTNYSQSRIASYENDIRLFRMAQLAIITGSGVSCLADCLNKPLLFLNSWHLMQVPFHRRTICVPTLVNDALGRPLSFIEQIELYKKTDAVEEIFPHHQFVARNADAEEILAALQELLSLVKEDSPRTDLQTQFRALANGVGYLDVTESRVSHGFLQKHQSRFGIARTLELH